MNFQTHPPRKLLFINIFGIGDVLFTTPLIRNLKEAFPRMQIGFLCNRRTVEILENHPHIDDIFVYERDEFNRMYQHSKMQFLRKWRELFQSIRNKGYDTAIDVSLNSSTSFLIWALGIPRRIGFNFRNRSFLLNIKIPLEGYERKHVIEYYLDLLRELHVPVPFKDLELNLKEKDFKWADEFLAKNGIRSGQAVVGLVPGGGASWGREAAYKRWASENYAKLADKIVEKFAVKIILFGDIKEGDLCLQVADAMKEKAASACGLTTICQMGSLMNRCRLTIVNDGGPLHVAVAAKVRTLSIFGPVDDGIYGPFPAGDHVVVKKNLDCQPCYRQFRKASCEHTSCLKTITVEEVFDKVKEILNKN